VSTKPAAAQNAASIGEKEVNITPDPLLTKAEVDKETGTCDRTRRRWEAAGIFPKRRYLTPNCVRWLESEVLAWKRSRPINRADAFKVRVDG
jgi:prophage regulatory protein